MLFLDVLRQRGNQYLEHMADAGAQRAAVPGRAWSLDGRALPRPVNYVPGRGSPRRPASSSMRRSGRSSSSTRAPATARGSAASRPTARSASPWRAGHPCYFVGFLPEPVPGQTIEDIMAAQAAFLERVIELHPDADGKPVVIGNCQGGWATMLVAATRPELFGPIIIAGAPLSYWAGVRGQNPMRYSGGLNGGSWLTALAGDLGHGIFDGAALVQNFENMNPSNTLWSKQYNLYAKVDTEGPRYLGFEKWWGGHVLLNAEEMQWIVDNLFVGNKLATAEIVTERRRCGSTCATSTRRSSASARKGDDITPPQQALGWILDLYGSVDDIRANGQTIVYCVHDKVGHLGIFVSGGVAKKEHAGVRHQHRLHRLPAARALRGRADAGGRGRAMPAAASWSATMWCGSTQRTLDDIRALGGNDLEDERKFAAVARLSEINLGLYRTFLQPWRAGGRPPSRRRSCCAG